MASLLASNSHYLSGVKLGRKDIGIGAYAKVFEVEFCGGSYAAKQIHATLRESMKQENESFHCRMFSKL